MSVDYFPALDDQYRDFSGSLYPVAGVCGSDRRCDTVVPSGESRGAGWENAAGIAVEIPQARILSVRADYGTIGEVTAYFLINGQSVAEGAGQNQPDYDKNKFHAVRLDKLTKIYRLFTHLVIQKSTCIRFNMISEVIISSEYDSER